LPDVLTQATLSKHPHLRQLSGIVELLHNYTFSKLTMKAEGVTFNVH